MAGDSAKKSKAAKERGAKAYRTGLIAEETAARFLKTRGYTILAHRYRTPHGEIDLIARTEHVLIFVEVKARATHAEAASAISAKQWARLEASALHYSAETGSMAADMRFDVILVGANGQCKQIENAVLFNEW